jgi:hypothetical protein
VKAAELASGDYAKVSTTAIDAFEALAERQKRFMAHGHRVGQGHGAAEPAGDREGEPGGDAEAEEEGRRRHGQQDRTTSSATSSAPWAA